MVGRVPVWRSPCVQPSDIEVWEAVQWPGDLKAVPTNCIVCSVRGKGITALAGGDSDGDDVAALRFKAWHSAFALDRTLASWG